MSDNNITLVLENVISTWMKRFLKISFLKICIISISFLIHQSLFAQTQNSPISTESIFAILKENCPDSIQQDIEETPDDSLIDLTYSWDGNDKSLYYWLCQEGEDSRLKTQSIQLY